MTARAARPPARIAPLAGAVAAIVLLAFGVAGAAPETFDENERALILSHGPWPPAAERDPSNRVSGDRRAAAFGQLLFFDPGLSANGEIACATCHKPEAAFADGRPVARGLAEGTRNTIGLFDVAHRRWFGWDGAGDSLWWQSLRPLLDATEMGSDGPAIARRIRTEPRLACTYRAVFGRPAGAVEDWALAVDVAKALAAFQETLVSGRSPFDRFRDALVTGDRAGMAAYPAAAARGLKTFVGRGNCSTCHFGPHFTNEEFADIGIPFFTAGGKVDPGRHGGIGKLRANRFNRAGDWSDEPKDAGGRRPGAWATETVDLQHRNFGEFRVPGLRNLGRTAPYMHNGRLADLSAVVRHYSELDENRLHADGEAILRPLHLTESEIDDLVAFLESLNADEPPPASPPLPEIECGG